MTPTEPSAPRITRKTVIVAGLILLILLAGILEFATRVYLRAYRGYDGEHLYQFAFDPYKNILPTPNYVDTRGIKHNSVGFRRSTEVSVAKPAGTYRIFLMGASTAYGLGGLWPQIDDHYPVLKNEETIDAYLERDLSTQLPGRTIEVINAGITSSWTHHNLIYLNQTILRYQPDMVLFLDGFNDYYFYDEGHDQFKSYTYSLPSQVVLGEPTIYSLAYANGWWLFRKSALVHQLAAGAKNLHLLLAKHGPRTPVDVDKAVAAQERVFKANALKMEERSGLILENEGVIPVFMLQPMLILERNRAGMTGVERQLFDFNVSSYLPNYEQFITRAVQTVRDRESAMAAHVGGVFIDLTPIYESSEGQIFTDYAHLTPLGNQIAAQHIAERILPIIRQATGQDSLPH
jgi:lysophospholipase L1-like esterase